MDFYYKLHSGYSYLSGQEVQSDRKRNQIMAYTSVTELLILTQTVIQLKSAFPYRFHAILGPQPDHNRGLPTLC